MSLRGEKPRVLGILNRKVNYECVKTPRRAGSDQIVTRDSASLNGITIYEVSKTDYRTICKHDRRCHSYVR